MISLFSTPVAGFSVHGVVHAILTGIGPGDLQTLSFLDKVIPEWNDGTTACWTGASTPRTLPPGVHMSLRSVVAPNGGSSPALSSLFLHHTSIIMHVTMNKWPPSLLLLPGAQCKARRNVARERL